MRRGIQAMIVWAVKTRAARGPAVVASTATVLAAITFAGVAGAWGAAPKQPLPRMYDLVINGEEFQVEANRSVTLESRNHPGTKYQVALRVAQVQRLPMNSLEVDYDLGFTVEDDEGRQVRTATLTHELGFSLQLADLGGPLPEADVDESLRNLAEVVREGLLADGAVDLESGRPFSQDLAGGTANGLTMTYGDADGFGRTCTVYLLRGPKYSATGIVRYMDADRDDVAPLIERTLGTVRARRGR
jgi:hypothetical protein